MQISQATNLSFDEFPRTGKAAWTAQILEDIRKATAAEKQAVYDDKMRWKTYEGITVEPFYTQEDLPHTSSGILTRRQSWQNRQYIQVNEARKANNTALEAIRGGADALLLDLRAYTHSQVNLSQLLQNIKLSEVPVSFQMQNFSLEFLHQLTQTAPYQWKGSLFYDPLADQLSGKAVDISGHMDLLAQAITFTKAHPHFRTLTVSGHHFHEAGASAVQELAFLLSTFVEYAHLLTDKGITIDDISNSTELSVSVSNNYFTEIAKLRALQLLWQQLVSAYGVHPGFASIHVQTALWNKPSADAYNNLIRTTIEAMTAVLGGADSITVQPYNHTPDDAFATRIARNVSLILKEESYFDKVLNAASGSYYIEHLTYTFAAEAWKLFQAIDAKGGFIQAAKEGFIREQITRVRKAREADLQRGKQVMVGLNKYAPEGSSEPGFAGFKDWWD